MILYHGSNVEIVEIDLQKSRPNKDFGRGFYLSANHDQALRMAQFKTKIEIHERDYLSVFFRHRECHFKTS